MSDLGTRKASQNKVAEHNEALGVTIHVLKAAAYTPK
jgi:hypothetical protein